MQYKLLTEIDTQTISLRNMDYRVNQGVISQSPEDRSSNSKIGSKFLINQKTAASSILKKQQDEIAQWWQNQVHR